MEHNAISIKLLQPSDVPAMQEIYKHYLGRATLHLNLPPPKYFLNLLDNASVWGFYSQSVLIGWGAIKRYSDKEGYQYTCETSTFLHPDHLNKGFGTTFKRFLMSQCKEMGFKYIVARIMSQNKRSIHYNIKLGYRIVGEQKSIGWIEDQPYDVTIMEYLIQ